MLFNRRGSHNISDYPAATNDAGSSYRNFAQPTHDGHIDDINNNDQSRNQLFHNHQNHHLHRHHLLSHNHRSLHEVMSTIPEGGIVNIAMDMSDLKSQPPTIHHSNLSSFGKKSKLKLTWTDVSFTVNTTNWSWPEASVFPTRVEKTKRILETQSGQVASGQLIGIIGPSGAGKSTLLNCLTGRYRDQHGLTGSVYVTRDGLTKKNRDINVAFIPQKDNLFANFTVKETLIFASKMKNTQSGFAAGSTSSSSVSGSDSGSDESVNVVKAFDHEREAVKVMKYLNLETCSKVTIKKCSGGQVKRVCIGVELISRPDILVLDEPTTGLDSSTAYQCVSILKTLVECKSSPPAILATIHQPSCKILMKFNLIYLLSKNGKCLYFGPPDQIKGYFTSSGLEYPMDYNPADFAIETAYGDYGEDAIFDHLQQVTAKTTSLMLADSQALEVHQERIKITTIVKSMESRPYSVLGHVALLLVRNWKKIYRDSGQLYLRVFQNIVIGLMVSFLWNPDIGQENGCWSDFLESGAKAANATDAKNHYLTKITRINSNSALIFAFLIYVIMVSVMSTVLSFPSETLVILKEMKNNWYSCSSYYWSKVIAEIPILSLMILILAAIIYPLTGQIPVLWRFALVYLVTCLMGEVCQSIGMLFGTIFSNDLISACFSSVASGFPPILFGGFVVQIQYIRWYLKPFAYLSYLKYAFESVVIAIYGFDRCTVKINSNSVVDNIAKAKNPVELIGTLVSSFNLTAKDAQTFSVLLGVDTTCVEGVINGTIDYFGINKGDPLPDGGPTSFGNSTEDSTEDGDYDYESTTTTTIRPKYSIPGRSTASNPSDEQASYVLSYFGLKDDVIYTNILALTLFVIVFKVLTYLVLLHKSRK